MDDCKQQTCENCRKQSKPLESYLITQCAPTLASIKVANLFSLSFDCGEVFEEHIRYWNRQMSEKGIVLTVLQQKENWALVYVYRPKLLMRDLAKQGVAEFLKTCGYDNFYLSDMLARLRERIAESDTFPHEIGIFLGYPLGDVIGFIVNKGNNCKCSGCWKVYEDEEEAVATFARYKKCTKIYSDLWSAGSRSIYQLAVSA